MSDLYAKSGVSIDAGNEAVRRIKKFLPNVGHFGGLFDLSEILKSYKNPVLVQSIDGVGTKLIVAKMMKRYDSVGEDIVNHSLNDIVAMGARPLTFLDYIASERLEPEVVEQMVQGMSRACREASVALIGGETAEMPGTYAPGEHDVAGCITGIVDKYKIITGENIKEGDVILGLPSSGLHTNGFSLARKLIFEVAGHEVGTFVPELEMTVGEALLKVHINYAGPVLEMIDKGIDLRGIVHITGGGMLENIPRVLPGNLNAEIIRGSWPPLSIFPFIQKIGKVEESEMCKVFNMGIGMVLIVPKFEVEKAKIITTVYEIGKVINGVGKVELK